MKKEFSQEDVERILKSDTEIPASVDQRIRETYQKLGITEKSTAKTSRMRRVRKHRHKALVSAAAAAAILAGFGLTAFAAVKILDIKITEEDGKVAQSVTVDSTAKEAHKIEVSVDYVPEGYVYQESGPFAGKYRNEETNGTLSVVSANAAELARAQAYDSTIFATVYNKDYYVGTYEENGKTMTVYQTDSMYTDDDSVTQNTYLFNEEEGYVVWVYLSGTGLPQDEARKVAENVKITVLDETEPYPTEEELAMIQEKLKDEHTSPSSQIDDSQIFKIGDTLSAPDFFDRAPDGEASLTDIQYKITDIQVLDSLPLDQYPKENYIPDYDSQIAPLLNEDGTLRPHNRYTDFEGANVTDRSEAETINSKFVVATVEITNTSSHSGEFYIAPTLGLLEKDEKSGLYKEYRYLSATKSYSIFHDGDGMPFYQTIQQFTENSKKAIHFADISSGETLTCTFAYVVDEDSLDDAYLGVFDQDGDNRNFPRVKVTE